MEEALTKRDLLYAPNSKEFENTLRHICETYYEIEFYSNAMQHWSNKSVNQYFMVI